MFVAKEGVTDTGDYRKLQGVTWGLHRVTIDYNGLQGVIGLTEGFKVLHVQEKTGNVHGVTKGYRGLQGVTRGYRGLQEVTRGYRGLQGVTEGYKELQGVTRGYRGLQGVTGGYKEL